jgi:phosphonate transport system substrate-binding protein
MSLGFIYEISTTLICQSRKAHMRGVVALFIRLVFITTACCGSLILSAEYTSYDFGVVPQYEQRKLFKIWRPILDELETRTGIRFNLIGSAKIPIFEKKYMKGVFDFAYMNPYHSLKAKDSQGYVPLVRDGGRTLKGILVVMKQSQISSIKELQGTRVAFPAPHAVGASLLMRAELEKLHNVVVVPHYVQTHSSVYLHVALGLTDAGGGVASTMNAQKPEIKEKLRVLYETRPMNPHPISVHPRVPKPHQEKVLKALLEMAKSEQGAELLARVPIVKMVQASIDDYVPMSAWGLDEFYESGD